MKLIKIQRTNKYFVLLTLFPFSNFSKIVEFPQTHCHWIFFSPSGLNYFELSVIYLPKSFLPQVRFLLLRIHFHWVAKIWIPLAIFLQFLKFSLKFYPPWRERVSFIPIKIVLNFHQGVQMISTLEVIRNSKIYSSPIINLWLPFEYCQIRLVVIGFTILLQSSFYLLVIKISNILIQLGFNRIHDKMDGLYFLRRNWGMIKNLHHYFQDKEPITFHYLN